MAVLFQDDFSVVAGSLGSGWTEEVGNFGTNAASGGIAVINATGVSLASALASEQTDQYVQCFCQVPDADNNAGIAWRIKNSDNYYYLIFNTTTNLLSVGKNEATAFSIIQSATLSFSGATWYRLGVQMIADQISVYLDDVYQDNTGVGLGAGEGPQLQFTDTTHTGLGKAGIVSVGNDLTDASGPLWNDFTCHDGQPETIYVDTAGSAPDALGSLASPDSNLNWAFNHVAMVKGGTVKVLNTGASPITNAVGKFRLGHAGKFSGVGSFPTYSDVNGQELTPGSPNLIIEGNDAGTSIFREVASGPFFDIRGDASWILVRGVTFDMTGGVSSVFIRTVPTNQLGASVEHSFRIVKSRLEVGNTGLNDVEGIVITQDATSAGLELCYCTSEATTFIDSIIRADDFAIGSLNIRRCIFKGPSRRHVNLVGGPASGNTWVLDHCDFLDFGDGTTTNIAVEAADGSKIIGDVEIKNSLVRGNASAEFGFAVIAGAVAGSIGAHHCGFFGVSLALADVDDDGNNVSTDPAFNDESVSWSWLQSRVLPSGTPILLPSDWEPTEEDYIDVADDAQWGVKFDIGAVEGSQVYNPGGEDPGPVDGNDPDTDPDGHVVPPYVATNPLVPEEGIVVAETIDVLTRWIRKTTGTVIQEFERRLSDKVITNQLQTVVTLSAADANIEVPFGQGFTNSTYNSIKVGNQAITYSVDGISAHHRIEAGGMALWTGSISSLYLTNTSATESVDVEIALAGD